MPYGDWQFWIVTLIMLAALWWVIKPLLPQRKPTRRRAALTIEGHDVDRS